MMANLEWYERNSCRVLISVEWRVAGLQYTLRGKKQSSRMQRRVIANKPKLCSYRQVSHYFCFLCGDMFHTYLAKNSQIQSLYRKDATVMH